VLRAQSVPLADRIGFIDTVMALLPYGFRARMTAATWTRATYRDHRFRLFFSNAPRATDERDHVVTWGHPETAVITPANGAAHEYLTWLEDTVSRPIGRLAQLTDPLGFGSKAGRIALDLAKVAPVPREPGPDRPVAQVTPSDGPPSATAPSVPAATTSAEAPDLRSMALALWRERDAHPKRLARWFASGRVSDVRLITLLAGERDSPQDARAICDLTLEYLETMQRSLRLSALRHALRRSGFLAQVLAADGVGDDQYQVTTLARFLRAAYPNGLDRPTILLVLAEISIPPTPALLAAVLTLLTRQRDAHLAREAFALGSVRRLSLAPDAVEQLADRLPVFDYDQQDEP
jgi:hypothetical protein